jgi:hypothetical protein
MIQGVQGMQRKIGWICGLSLSLGLAALVSGTANATRPVAIEKELLGVRVLQNYKAVLARYGAPTRIFRATETVNYLEATNLQGESTGGILGVQDASSSGGGGGGYPGGPGGYPGASSGPGGSSGYPGVSGPSGGSSGYPGGSSGPSGGGNSATDNPDASYGEAGGFTWVYLYPFKELAYEFSFNRDGRVERIAELGRGFGQHTSRGIGLGDTVDKVYSVYGWTDRIKEEDTNKFSLLYNDRYHAHFLVAKNKVVGISVFLKENQYIHFQGGSGGSGGGGGGKLSGGPVASGAGGGGGKPRIGPSASGGGGKGAGVGRSAD